jgi:quercetin dioxygenase-like cupin family protein
MTRPTRFLARASGTTALVWIAGTIATACAEQAPTAETSSGIQHDRPGVPHPAVEPPPIATEFLTARHDLTDDIAVQFRLKPEGRSQAVVNAMAPSKLAVLRITVQPGARFPWHMHPGPVMVAVTQGDLVYVYADDCVERTYPNGTALVDPGNNIHYAFNPTSGETVLIATFLDVPASGPLTIPVEAGTATTLDQKCGVAPAALHQH